MIKDWWTVWYQPEEDDIIAYITAYKLSTIGGSTMNQGVQHVTNDFVQQGIGVISRWCRLNCTTMPTPVNVKGRLGFAFKHSQDALLFKLTWG
jgi:hypothetical protein